MKIINKVKLTKRIVESIEPNPTKRLFIWDTEVTGFCLRVYPSGKKTYFIQYRNKNKKTHKIKIGVHGNITTELAREKAIKFSLNINLGEDPACDKHTLQQVLSMEDLAREYVDVYAKTSKKEKSVKEDQKMLNNIILKHLGTKPIDDVTSHDLCVLHSKLKDTPYQANRVRSLLSKMFNLAIKWGWHNENPAKFVEKYQENAKLRWLDDEELSALLSILDKYHNQSVANAIRLLLLTGSRKNEVLHATWGQFDLMKGIWTKPAHFTKQKKEEHLPLSQQTITLLQDMKSKSKSDYLFPGKVEGKPLKDIKKAWATIIRLSGLQAVRIHDLRHTHASHLVSDGEDLYTVGKLLGHTQISTTQKYAHLANKPLKKAAAVFGNKFEKLSTQASA